MDIKILITQMTELFLVMFLGYFIYKIKMVDDNFEKKLTRFILDIALPSMILASVLKLTQREALCDVLTAFGIAVSLFFVLLPVIGFLLAKLLFVGSERAGLYTFMNTYSNVGFMGFPVIGALCGSVGLFYAAIFNLIFNLSIYTMGIWMMNKGNNNAVKFNPRCLLSPGVILSSMAIVIYFLNVDLPNVIDDTVQLVGSITSPAAMLLIGCSLAKMNIKNVFNDWRVYVWTLIKQIAIPLLLWLPLKAVITNPLLLQVTYILVAMPVANSAVLFATNYGGDTELAARSVFITTLFSLATVPLCVMMVM